MNRGTGIHVHSQPFANLEIGDTFSDGDYGEMIWNGKRWQTNNHEPITDIQFHDLVHYIPFEGCDESEYENGIVRLVQEETAIRVVYNCAGKWQNFIHYTSALTHKEQLRNGWIINPKKEENNVDQI